MIKLKEEYPDFKGYDYKDRYEIAMNIAKWAFYEPLDPQELGIEDNLEFLWDNYFSRKAGCLDADRYEDDFFNFETPEELAEFIAKFSLRTVRNIEKDLGIDEDTIKAENDYFNSIQNESFFNRKSRYITKKKPCKSYSIKEMYRRRFRKGIREDFSESMTYTVPGVSEENYEIIEKFVSRWGDKVDSFEWIPTDDGLGEFKLTADDFCAEMIILWLCRKGLTEIEKPYRYFMNMSVKSMNESGYWEDTSLDYKEELKAILEHNFDDISAIGKKCGYNILSDYRYSGDYICIDCLPIPRKYCDEDRFFKMLERLFKGQGCYFDLYNVSASGILGELRLCIKC